MADAPRTAPASVLAPPASTAPDHSAETREATRARLLAAIPARYSPWLHLSATTGFGALLLVAGAIFAREVQPLEWLVVPAMLLFANFVEWFAHKTLLHKRRRFFEPLFEQHTPVHHSAYHEADMAVRDWRELKLVLMPSIGLVAVVVALAPIAAVFGLLVTSNAAWLALVTAGSYLVSYELLHLAYHLPVAHPIAKLRVIRFLARHHGRHHDPRLMQRWNFNVTLPLFDWVLGTTWSAAREPASAQLPRKNASRIA